MTGAARLPAIRAPIESKIAVYRILKVVVGLGTSRYPRVNVPGSQPFEGKVSTLLDMPCGPRLKPKFSNKAPSARLPARDGFPQPPDSDPAPLNIADQAINRVWWSHNDNPSHGSTEDTNSSHLLKSEKRRSRSRLCSGLDILDAQHYRIGSDTGRYVLSPCMRTNHLDV